MVDRRGCAEAIERAARLGDCWYGNADLTPDTAAEDMEIYREACARLDRSPVRIPIRKDVFIAEHRADAEKVGDELVARGYRGFDRRAVAYGDPDSVAEQLSVFGDQGFTDIIIRTMAPLPARNGSRRGGPLRRAGSRRTLPPRLSRPGRIRIISDVAHQWPRVSYEDWSETCDTLHAHTQLLGKLAIASHRPNRSSSTPPSG